MDNIQDVSNILNIFGKRSLVDRCVNGSIGDPGATHTSAKMEDCISWCVYWSFIFFNGSFYIWTVFRLAIIRISATTLTRKFLYE